MALSCAPGELAVQMGAYLFYFYNHRYADALPHAETILEMAARRLNVPCDFADVRPDDADFSALETAPSIYLQALLAYGYCHLRLNDFEAGRTAIAKVCELDPTDRFHAAAIIEIVETGDGDD